MTAYEMMLSESQERMLMVLKPGKEDEARAIFEKWGLDFAVVGRTTDDLRFVVRRYGETVADLPIKELGDEAPVYDRPWEPTPQRPALSPDAVPAPESLPDALLRLVGSPDLCSRRWIWEQYDHLILGNTLQRPGGAAAVVRVDADRPKALAFTLDVTPRYCRADPVEGGKQAVAEAWRNLNAVGATPLGVTDCLNFGSPERPEIMGQLVGAIAGMAEACTALSFPVVSGNVSLYNETSGAAILPTPAIGGVGLIDNVARTATIAFRDAGDALVLIGETAGHLGASVYLREILGRDEGPPPPVDLAAEKRNGELVRRLIAESLVTAVHDCSDGGLLVALAEMAMAGDMGAEIALPPLQVPAHAFLFGEDQARYVVACAAGDLDTVLRAAQAAGVPAVHLGATCGDALTIDGFPPIYVADLRARHEAWLPDFMSGGV
jgi:phosphoribosylformylglycinamidine synthase subunit PurL